MPTYDYACRECGHRFDVVQSIHDDALTTCPECGGPLRRVVGAVGVQFKGSGFYMTDNRGKASSKSKVSSATGGSEGSKDTPATGSASSATADAGKSDAKPAPAAKGKESSSGGD